jgi:hypothetical protein
MSTLKDAPLVGKIKAKSNGEIDFTSHNATVVTRIDEHGQEYQDIEFNSDAFGTFTDVNIEEIDGVESIVANCKVWKRFYDASQLIQKRIKAGTLSTSWEISVEDSDKKIVSGEMIKVINKGRFIGHALLSATIPPAYPRSKVLEVASSEEDQELCSAILQDILTLNQKSQGNEVQSMNENENVIDNTEQKPADSPIVEQAEDTPPVVEQPAEPTLEEKPVVAELTMRDLRRRIEDALYAFTERYLDVVFIFTELHTGWAHACDENETDMYEFSYAVENEEVTVTSNNAVKLLVSPRELNASLSERDTTIVNLNTKINELSATVASLSPFKSAFEKAEADRIKAEHEAAESTLRQFVEDSGMFAKEEIESKEISALISDLKTSEIDAIISKRVVAKNAKQRKPETASVKSQPKEKLDIDSPTVDSYTILKNHIHAK